LWVVVAMKQEKTSSRLKVEIEQVSYCNQLARSWTPNLCAVCDRTKARPPTDTTESTPTDRYHRKHTSPCRKNKGHGMKALKQAYGGPIQKHFDGKSKLHRVFQVFLFFQQGAIDRSQVGNETSHCEKRGAISEFYSTFHLLKCRALHTVCLKVISICDFRVHPFLFWRRDIFRLKSHLVTTDC
jgi:hypothetical protein